jgi:hypothetical protein
MASFRPQKNRQLIQHHCDTLRFLSGDIIPEKNYGPIQIIQIRRPGKASYDILFITYFKIIPGMGVISERSVREIKEQDIHLIIDYFLSATPGYLKLLGYYFERFGLKTIYCQPYALNSAPNNALRHVGFQFVKSYNTVPGRLNFMQPVNLWQLSCYAYAAITAE